MWLEDKGIQATHLIHDRDTKFTKAFDQLMGTAEIKIVQSPVKAPNANAFAESWTATLRRECLNYFACFSLRHAGHIVRTFVNYYNTRRPHQGVGNRVPGQPNQLKLSSTDHDRPIGRIGGRSELGGLLKHYYHAA